MNGMQETRRDIYKELHQKNPNFVWRPWAWPIFLIASRFIRSFQTKASFESEIPRDGAVIIACNHQNFYDSLVCSAVIKKFHYLCFAGDEPRGTIRGLSFEARGAVWVDRSDPHSRDNASVLLTNAISRGLSVAWSPEGTWNTTENRLMLPISRGMAKIAIEAAKCTKVYIVPVVMDYQYKENSHKVKRASVRVCKAVSVSPKDTPEELTERLEIIFWTTRWEQIEAQMALSPYRIPTEDGFVYPRARLSREKWRHFVDKLHSQYKCDWSAEESYAIKTQVQKDHTEIKRVLSHYFDREEDQYGRGF